MLRFFAGVVSALLLVAAGLFFWRSNAEAEQIIPPAPKTAAYAGSLLPRQSAQQAPELPGAAEKTKEQKRFARADKDDDCRITREELLTPRRKAFVKLDKNGNGSLSFEEWGVKTVDKFQNADADGSGWLTAAEYESTKPKPARQKKCAC